MGFDEFKQIVYLLSCGAQNITPKIDEKIDMDEIFKIAAAQNVLPCVIFAVRLAWEKNESIAKKSDINKINNTLMAFAVRETRRRFVISKLLANFREHRINACILKGDSLCELYFDETLRVSGDTDIYTDCRNVRELSKILEEVGFRVNPKAPESHHIVASHSDGGIVEVHLSMHDEIFEDAWFENTSEIKQDYVTKTMKDGFSFQALAATDEFIFVTFHFIKHFLTSGAGIKQFADVCLFVKKHKSDIDFVRVDDILKKLKYDKFFDICMSMAVEYFQLDMNDVHFVNAYLRDTDLFDALMMDMYTGGVFGREDKKRERFYFEYTKQRFKSLKGEKEYEKYMKNVRRKNKLKQIILSRDSLEKRYPYVKKSIVLIPAGHIHHAFDIVLGIVSGKRKISEYTKKDNAETNDTIEKRMELIKKLKMI